MVERPKTFGKRRSLRLRHFDYRSPGPYHVTVGTFNRRLLPISVLLLRALIAELAAAATSTGTTVYAYCFMPDHAHFLVALSGQMDLTQFMQRFKGRSTRAFWQQGGAGRLWQRGFYDHVLRPEEDMRETARYIVANPVRRGLVRDFRDYPGAGSLVFPLDEL